MCVIYTVVCCREHCRRRRCSHYTHSAHTAGTGWSCHRCRRRCRRRVISIGYGDPRKLYAYIYIRVLIAIVRYYNITSIMYICSNTTCWRLAIRQIAQHPRYFYKYLITSQIGKLWRISFNRSKNDSLIFWISSVRFKLSDFSLQRLWVIHRWQVFLWVSCRIPQKHVRAADATANPIESIFGRVNHIDVFVFCVCVKCVIVWVGNRELNDTRYDWCDFGIWPVALRRTTTKVHRRAWPFFLVECISRLCTRRHTIVQYPTLPLTNGAPLWLRRVSVVVLCLYASNRNNMIRISLRYAEAVFFRPTRPFRVCISTW